MHPKTGFQYWNPRLFFRIGREAGLAGRHFPAGEFPGESVSVPNAGFRMSERHHRTDPADCHA